MLIAALNGGILIIVALVALMYVLFIRPQQARQQAQRAQHDAVEPGDEVLTVGGIYGIVQELDEEGDLIVEIADGIHVRVARRGVATVVKPDEDEEDVVADEHDAADDPAEASADTNPPVH